jgi:O-antigen/teichoic acid export membrane protein
VPAAGGAFLFPLVSRRIEAGENVRRIALAATFALGLFAGALSLPLMFFGNAILTLWIGHNFADQNSGLLAWLTVAFILLALNIGPHFLLLGRNKAWFVAVSNIAGGVMATFAGAYLIPRIGVGGAALMRIGYSLVTCSNIIAMISVLAGHAKRQEGKKLS